MGRVRSQRPSDRMKAAIALGGNLGDSRRILAEAVEAIDREKDMAVIARSPLYKTAPVGPPQPDYINACILIETTLAPRALLRKLLDIENAFGRVRKERWGARSLDLDILLIEQVVMDSLGLTVPHPRLHERAFVLVPLAEIAPHWQHPIFAKTIAQLLYQLQTHVGLENPLAGVVCLEPCESSAT